MRSTVVDAVTEWETVSQTWGCTGTRSCVFKPWGGNTVQMPVCQSVVAVSHKPTRWCCFHMKLRLFPHQISYFHPSRIGIWIFFSSYKNDRKWRWLQLVSCLLSKGLHMHPSLLGSSLSKFVALIWRHAFQRLLKPLFWALKGLMVALGGFGGCILFCLVLCWVATLLVPVDEACIQWARPPGRRYRAWQPVLFSASADVRVCVFWPGGPRTPVFSSVCSSWLFPVGC